MTRESVLLSICIYKVKVEVLSQILRHEDCDDIIPFEQLDVDLIKLSAEAK